LFVIHGIIITILYALAIANELGRQKAKTNTEKPFLPIRLKHKKSIETRNQRRDGRQQPGHSRSMTKQQLGDRAMFTGDHCVSCKMRPTFLSKEQRGLICITDRVYFE
jgi:hypothetical protein